MRAKLGKTAISARSAVLAATLQALPPGKEYRQARRALSS
jgi:hypothetical protein